MSIFYPMKRNAPEQIEKASKPAFLTEISGSKKLFNTVVLHYDMSSNVNEFSQMLVTRISLDAQHHRVRAWRVF